MAKPSIPDSDLRKPEFTVESWSTAFPLIRSHWANLIAEKDLNPSLHPDWVNAVVEGFSKSEETQILYYKDKQSIRGLVSFFNCRSRILTIPVNEIQLTSNLVSYHPEIVSSCDQVTLLEQLIRCTTGWHVLRVANLMKDGPTAKALEQLAERTGLRLLAYSIDSSPYLAVTTNWNEFLASKNKKFRYKYRQRQKSLIDGGGLAMSWYSSAKHVETLLENMLTIESRSWKADKGVDIAGSNIETRYYSRLLPFLAKTNSLMANVLYANSTPVAYNLCCNWNGWVGQLKTSFDPKFRDLSPGSVVVDAAIKRTFDIRAREFDFLGHADPHKLAWTSTTREHSDYFLYSRAIRARLIGAVRAFKRKQT